MFVSSLVAAGGAFFYKQWLGTSLAQKMESLQKIQGAFDPNSIQDLLRIDARINNANTLLQKHVAPSAIFDFIASQTLQAVQLNSFSYSLQTDGGASIGVTGQAADFATVALQSDQFGNNKLLKNVVFSGISQDPKTRVVSFSMSAVLNASVINYKKTLGVSPTDIPSEQTSPATATSTQQSNIPPPAR